MIRWLVTSTALGVLGLTLGPLVAAAPAAAEDTAARDAATVFCLSPAQRANLASAVVGLGLAAPADTTGWLDPITGERAIVGWRAGHRAAFDRACAGLRAASPEPPSRAGGDAGFWPSVISVLISVSAGALLTYLTGAWRDAVSRGRERAAALREAVEGFVDAGTEYAAGWANPNRLDAPSIAALRAGRARLDTQLRRVAATHPAWSVPRSLRQRLAGGPLREAGREAVWVRSAPDERAARAGELELDLRELYEEVERIASALERPSRPHWGMRRGTPVPGAVRP